MPIELASYVVHVSFLAALLNIIHSFMHSYLNGLSVAPYVANYICISMGYLATYHNKTVCNKMYLY